MVTNDFIQLIYPVMSSDCSLLGTGSYPEYLLKGWHLRILFIERKDPYKVPCVFNAFNAYSEHVGSNRQFFPVRGLMKSRYI